MNVEAIYRGLRDRRRKIIRIALLLFVLVTVPQAIRWAMLPGFWMGSMLGGGDTALETAQHHFGPILLVKHWISDPEGTWGTQEEVLTQWGYHESAARLRLIIWSLCIGVCVLLAVGLKRRTQHQPGGDA